MVLAKIAYDGTHYFGWQKTLTGPSVQQALEKALSPLTHQPLQIDAASRTDRGVHAEGQVVQFNLEKTWDPKTLMQAMNARLPGDIRVLEVFDQPFHPSLDALKKEYIYRLNLNPVQDPHERLYSWHVYHPICKNKVEKAKNLLLGTHDFSGFANRDAEGKEDPVCTLESIEFDGSNFFIKGSRFLYKMVRNIVGTLVYIGIGRLEKQIIPEMLTTKSRKIGGVTAPAHGLYLHQVFYPVQ